MERWIGYFCTQLIWGFPLVLFIAVTGAEFAIRSRGRFLAGPTQLKRAFSESAGEGMHPFEAFALTVGGKIGVGNVVGVALAMETGGPGALLWMALFAIPGAALSYVECSTAARLGGGPPTYLRLSGKRRTAALFGRLTVAVTAVFMPSIQVNATARTVVAQANGGRGSLLLIGAVMAGAFLLCCCFGERRIARITAWLTPLAAGVYLVAALAVVAVCRERLPQALTEMLQGAFGRQAMLSGAAASALSVGVRRGMFSCEAGYGIAPYAAAKTSGDPHRIGVVQSFGVIFDTLILCTLTGLMLLCAQTNDASEAFGLVFGGFGRVLLTVIVALFAFTTLLSCGFTATTDASGKDKKTRRVCILLLMSGVIVCSAAAAPQLIWALCDGACGIMAAINLLALRRLNRKNLTRPRKRDYNETNSSYGSKGRKEYENRFRKAL